MNKIEKFVWYLLKNHHIYTTVAVNKILFFIRVYEKMNNITNSPIFDKKNYNFQAWTSGPVNVEAYYFAYSCIYHGREAKIHFSFLYNQKIKKYLPIIKKTRNMEEYDLMNYSRQNREYISVRSNFKDYEPCTESLDENKKRFQRFLSIHKEIISKIYGK